MNTFNDRFKIAFNKSGLSQHDLARSVNVSQPAIRKLVAGDTKSFRKISELAQALKVNVEWLSSGHGDSGLDVPQFEFMGAVKSGAVKVKGEAVMGANGAFEMDESLSGYLKFYSDDPAAFSLRVKGDSMFPRINSGEFVVIEPQVVPASGDEVFIKLKDGRYMIKKLEYLRNREYRFTSINQDHPPITISSELVDKVMYVSAIVKSSRYIDVNDVTN
jgi:phage repressor protein C with HTH and peptisase S24 domain